MRKLSIFVLAIGMYCAGWFMGASYLKNKLETFQKIQQEQLREFSYQKVEIKGFPFRYELHFDHPSFKGPVKNLGLEVGGDLNVHWQGEKCVVMAKLWNWRAFTLNAEGKHLVHLTREAHPGFTVGFQHLGGKIFLNHRRRVTQFDLETIQPTVGYFSGTSLATAEKLTLSFRRAHQITAAENTAVDKIDCALDQLNIHNKTLIDRIHLQCNVLNPFSRGSVVRGLKIWRDDGGTVEVNQLDMQWKGTSLNVKGTVSLDASLRPLAGMVITISDYKKILEAFVAEKWLKPKEALTANLALSFIKTAGSSVLEIPLSIQEGKMSVGPLLFSPIPSLEDMLKI